MPAKVVILGAGGQLATDIAAELAPYRELRQLPHAALAIEDHAAVREMLAQEKPGVVINTAAFHNCVRCEEDPQTAFLVNATAVKGLADACREAGAVFVHFSTDYVFGADRTRTVPYVETDAPGPVNVYGVSKWAGEALALQYCPKALVLRVCGLYGRARSSAKQHGNFVEMMMALGRKNRELPSACDQTLTFTSTRSVSRVVRMLLDREATGLFHATSEGASRRCDFVRKLFAIKGIDCTLQEVPSAFFKPKYEQPVYSVLDNTRLKALGIVMPAWEEALEEYLWETTGE